MLSKKIIGTFVLAVAFVSLTMSIGDFAYAEKRGIETEAAPMPPECPNCKSVHASHTQGSATAPMVMSCPDCKKETTEIGVYHCSKCEKEFLVCINCQAATKVNAETRCPKCKKVRARHIKGKIEVPVKWEMKCPECKKNPEDLLLQHCDECNADFLACPLCENEKKKSS